MVILLLNIKTTCFRLVEWLRVIVRYYRRSLHFLWADCLLALNYFWRNPHRISRSFLIKRGAQNIYGFGETPLTSLDLIARECRILSKDVVYELGCGSARSCFWLRTFVQCRVVGIDYVPEFIHKAKKVKKWASFDKIDFIESDMLHVNLAKATFIYLYGTCLEEVTLQKLCLAFNQLKTHTKIITVSFPLTDYSDCFTVTKYFTARFPWGEAYVFLNEKC